MALTRPAHDCASARLLHVHHAERGQEEGEAVDGQRARVLVGCLRQRRANACRQRARDVGRDQHRRPVAELERRDLVSNLRRRRRDRQKGIATTPTPLRTLSSIIRFDFN